MTKAVPSKRPAPSYTFQRVHAALQTGAVLTVQQKRQEPMPCFMQQSMLDGACGVHVLAMALVILDLAKASALHNMSRRTYGTVAQVHRAFEPTYFTGINAREWVAQVQGLDLPLALKASYVADGGVDGAAVDWLMRGDLVALAFASVEHQRTKHWALAVGIEGFVSGQRHQPQRILLLDPSAPEPVVFQASNARLSLPQTGLGSRRAKSIENGKTSVQSRKPWLWRYESESWSPETVHLLAAVRVRRTP